MRSHLPLLLLAVGPLFCVGCVPEERFAWSPEGDRAVVIIHDQLHLSDETGRLLTSREVDEGEDRREAREVEWLRDGSGLVVSQIRVMTDWDALRATLPADEVTEVESLASRMPRLLESAAILLGPEADLGDIISHLEPESGGVDLSAFQLAWRRDREAIEVALNEAPMARAELAKVDAEAPGYPVYEISIDTLAPDRSGFAENVPILRSLRGIRGLALAPDGKSVAVGRQTEDQERVDLEIVSLADGARREVAAGIAPAFAWSRDGESLVYLESLSEKGGHLMRLMWHSLEAAGDTEPRHLATVLIPFAPRVAVLADGSILFAGQPIVLPASGRDPGRQPRLFRLSMPEGEIREIPTRPGALPMDLGSFVPSPDGSRVVIVESGSDAVAIVDLETGKSELVATSHPGWQCRTLPAWRDAQSLTHAILAGNGERIDWVIREESGETRRLNESWREEDTSGWMERRQDSESDKSP